MNDYAEKAVSVHAQVGNKMGDFVFVTLFLFHLVLQSRITYLFWDEMEFKLYFFLILKMEEELDW